MPFWPFVKGDPQPVTPTELRELLIRTAATGSARKLRAICRERRSEVADHLDVLKKVPESLPPECRSVDHYVQCLMLVAQCLARDCAAPELWNALCGNTADNPITRWEQWLACLPQRTAQLEYDALIGEARTLLEETRRSTGTAPRFYEIRLHGHLGILLFDCGRAAEAIPCFESALAACVETHDGEGQIAYLNSLLETHRYLADGLAVPTAKRLLECQTIQNLPTAALETRVRILQRGEPLCRIVCMHNGEQLELDEMHFVGDGRTEFRFERNRPTPAKATALTQQGNSLAASGQFADALEKYHAASEVDPYDPDPVYQSVVCLLELGAYAQARESAEEVERLAPGWFRCRTDRWLAAGLESGDISDEEARLLRLLEDGGLPREQTASLVDQALERFPEFAPFHLIRGDLHRRGGDEQRAIASYRRGLELTREPDLESRLLCALAAALPEAERPDLLRRVLALDGSLVSQASARLMSLK